MTCVFEISTYVNHFTFDSKGNSLNASFFFYTRGGQGRAMTDLRVVCFLLGIPFIDC